MRTQGIDRKVRVALGSRSYDVLVGNQVIDRIMSKLPKVGTRRAVLISDEKLMGPRAKTRAALSRAGWELHEIPVAAGEGLKDFSRLYPIYGSLLSAGIHRDCTLFALGGGTVGDAAGFIAATYLRGIPWVGLPTTLLAQVDSSIGGKTGINHEFGKNLVGAFYQPRFVACDTEFLKTLSPREMVSGLGEIIKYGFVFDEKFYSYMESHSSQLLHHDAEVLAVAIQKSLRFKAQVVSKDEFDNTGVREVLNFGHTFGHALEKVTQYSQFQHGEAIIWGMRFALALSWQRRKISKKVYLRGDTFLRGVDVPPLPKGVSFETYLGHMKKDKKVRQQKIHFVLLNDIGSSYSDARVDEKALRSAFELITAPVAQ